MNEIYRTQEQGHDSGADPGRRQDPPGQAPYTPSWQRPAGGSSDDPWRQSTTQQPTYQQPGYRTQPPGSGRPPGSRRPPDSGEVSERTARLTVTLLAASFAVLVIGLVVFFTVRTLRNADDGTVNAGPDVTTPEDAARAVGGIGPPPGIDLGPYIETRKAALAQATGDRVAVVSLGDYRTESDARALVGTGEVLALLAAGPGGQPSVVTGDVATWVGAQTADARAERDEIQKLIPTVKGDPEFQSFYRSEVDRLNKLISTIRPNGALVFGVVVRAPAPALQALGTKPEVRLVDVGPRADPGPKPTYRGIRPEETAKANDPNTRPL